MEKMKELESTKWRRQQQKCHGFLLIEMTQAENTSLGMKEWRWWPQSCFHSSFHFILGLSSQNREQIKNQVNETEWNKMRNFVMLLFYCREKEERTTFFLCRFLVIIGSSFFLSAHLINVLFITLWYSWKESLLIPFIQLNRRREWEEEWNRQE